MTNRFNSTKSLPAQSGLRGTHYEDFLAHSQGNAFRHLANNIDVVPQVTANSPTVQDTLVALNAEILAAGTGFII